jgi:predicted glycosyltransferase involved in capsule biosynthesis
MTEEQSDMIFDAGSVDEFADSIISAACLCDPRGKSPNATVETFSPATSVIAVNRKLALIVGGFDEQFSGWGGEDRDFAFKLLLANEQIEKPTEFPVTKT